MSLAKAKSGASNWGRRAWIMTRGCNTIDGLGGERRCSAARQTVEKVWAHTITTTIGTAREDGNVTKDVFEIYAYLLFFKCTSFASVYESYSNYHMLLVLTRSNQRLGTNVEGVGTMFPCLFVIPNSPKLGISVIMIIN